MMHSCKGYCFVDFACSGPYVDIDMHPAHDGAYLDAVFISPHKFLGGPGTPGIMVFNKKLYKNAVPDNCGGGTVVIPFVTILSLSLMLSTKKKTSSTYSLPHTFAD